MNITIKEEPITDDNMSTTTIVDKEEGNVTINEIEEMMGIKVGMVNLSKGIK